MNGKETTRWQRSSGNLITTISCSPNLARWRHETTRLLLPQDEHSCLVLLHIHMHIHTCAHTDTHTSAQIQKQMHMCKQVCEPSVPTHIQHHLICTIEQTICSGFCVFVQSICCGPHNIQWHDCNKIRQSFQLFNFHFSQTTNTITTMTLHLVCIILYHSGTVYRFRMSRALLLNKMKEHCYSLTEAKSQDKIETNWF